MRFPRELNLCGTPGHSVCGRRRLGGERRLVRCKEHGKPAQAGGGAAWQGGCKGRCEAPVILALLMTWSTF